MNRRMHCSVSSYVVIIILVPLLKSTLNKVQSVGDIHWHFQIDCYWRVVGLFNPTKIMNPKESVKVARNQNKTTHQSSLGNKSTVIPFKGQPPQLTQILGELWSPLSTLDNWIGILVLIKPISVNCLSLTNLQQTQTNLNNSLFI